MPYNTCAVKIFFFRQSKIPCRKSVTWFIESFALQIIIVIGKPERHVSKVTLWQQATVEIMRRNHSVTTCSCHIYSIWVLFFAHIATPTERLQMQICFKFFWHTRVLKFHKRHCHLAQGWANRGTRATRSPPQRFQWPTEAFRKIFKSEMSSNSSSRR